MKSILKITAGIMLAFGLLAGGCVAIIGLGANEVSKELDAQAAEGITAEQWAEVKRGMSREDVEELLGEPTSASETELDIPELEDLGMDSTSTHDCLHWDRAGELVGLYQACFENGRLQSKSSF